MKICVLGSSSAGNATYIELDGLKILVDAGLCYRSIKNRLAELGVEVSALDAIFITHEHADHINGLKTLLNHHKIPVYCTRFTAQAIEEILKIEADFYIFSQCEPFRFHTIQAEAFPVFHDAQDPVGFCFYTKNGKLGMVSDIGYLTLMVKQKLAGCHVLIVESNHDPKLLMADIRRPMSLKQRIKGKQGHLSNADACKLVDEIAHAQLKHVVLYHLSQDCNLPSLAYGLMKNTLSERGFHQTDIHLTYADKMSDVITYPWNAGENPGDEMFCQLEMPMV